MQSRETGRMTKTKSSSNPIVPSEPQQWGSFRFRNTAFSTNRNACACREPVPTDVTGNRLTAPAHTETHPAPLERHGSLQPQANPVCFNDVYSGDCSPRAVPWSAHGCPLQPQISRRRLGERWGQQQRLGNGSGGALSTHCPRCSYAPNSAITSHSQKQND